MGDDSVVAKWPSEYEVSVPSSLSFSNEKGRKGESRVEVKTVKEAG